MFLIVGPSTPLYAPAADCHVAPLLAMRCLLLAMTCVALLLMCSSQLMTHWQASAFHQLLLTDVPSTFQSKPLDKHSMSSPSQSPHIPASSLHHHPVLILGFEMYMCHQTSYNDIFHLQVMRQMCGIGIFAQVSCNFRCRWQGCQKPWPPVAS